jgi:GT2 family glycosyltransferase
VVPVFGQLELVRRCLTALDSQTPIEVPLMLIDDCGPEQLTDELIRDVVRTGREWRLVQNEKNLGFVGSVNEAFQMAGNADVVVVNSDVQVLSGWWQGLVAAIKDTPAVASASTLADNGGMLSVPALAGSAISADGLARAAACVPLTADLPVAVAHCTYFTRSALDAVGSFDPAFAPGYGEEVDWSFRAKRKGFRHVAALHSYVLHERAASFGTRSGLMTLQRRHEFRLLTRYPSAWFAVRRFARSPGTDLARAVVEISTALR